MKARLVGCIVSASFLFGCGSSSSTSDPPISDNLDCSITFDQVTAFSKCVTCHASTKTVAQRAKAPADINFDTESAARAHIDKAVSEVMKGDMPPRTSGLTLSSTEKQQIYDWAMCTM